MIDFGLAGSVIVVTGAASGIGRAIAQAAAVQARQLRSWTAILMLPERPHSSSRLPPALTCSTFVIRTPLTRYSTRSRPKWSDHWGGRRVRRVVSAGAR